MCAEYKLWRNKTVNALSVFSNVYLDEAEQVFYNNVLKESKGPEIIWKYIRSLNPSNHIRPHRLVTEYHLKVDKSIDIANTF